MGEIPIQNSRQNRRRTVGEIIMRNKCVAVRIVGAGDKSVA
jgi:hypothetical protein